MRVTWKSVIAAASVCGILAVSAVAGAPAKGSASVATNAPPAQSNPPDDEKRIEGEKRFQANCGRCHQFPHKFPPRMMLTIERHMRVRALVTDHDMRLIVGYLTQ